MSIEDGIGVFTDDLSETEVIYSKQIADELRQVPWAQKLFRDIKIERALQVQKDPNMSYASLNEIKSALFEVRFAYALYKKNFNVEYEKKTGVCGYSVDFTVIDKGNSWLIELTSLRESEAVKKATSQEKDFFKYESTSSNSNSNSPEVLDIIKLQNSIYGKVIKFPDVTPKKYHVVIIDSRSFNIGAAIKSDFDIAAYGSHRLRNCDQGLNCRYWYDEKNKSHSHILGIFEEKNDDKQSKLVREKVHFICFVLEKKYILNEIIQPMFLCHNTRYFQNLNEVENKWLFFD